MASADAIVLPGLLTRLPRPAAFLDALAPPLRPGGVVAIATDYGWDPSVTRHAERLLPTGGEQQVGTLLVIASRLGVGLANETDQGWVASATRYAEWLLPTGGDQLEGFMVLTGLLILTGLFPAQLAATGHHDWQLHNSERTRGRLLMRDPSKSECRRRPIKSHPGAFLMPLMRAPTTKCSASCRGCLLIQLRICCRAERRRAGGTVARTWYGHGGRRFRAGGRGGAPDGGAAGRPTVYRRRAALHRVEAAVTRE